jgi:hypothetical protein
MESAAEPGEESHPQSQEESVQPGRIQSLVRFILGKGHAMKFWKFFSEDEKPYTPTPIDEIEIPEPTRASAGYMEGVAIKQKSLGPSQGELKARALVKEVVALKTSRTD